jgi:hypothetical protein
MCRSAHHRVIADIVRCAIRKAAMDAPRKGASVGPQGRAGSFFTRQAVSLFRAFGTADSATVRPFPIYDRGSALGSDARLLTPRARPDIPRCIDQCGPAVAFSPNIDVFQLRRPTLLNFLRTFAGFVIAQDPCHRKAIFLAVFCDRL